MREEHVGSGELAGSKTKRRELTLHCDYVGDEERLAEEKNRNCG